MDWGLNMSSTFKKWFLISLLFPLFIPVWFFVAIPRLTEIPESFEYQANIFSLDNFFDEQKRDYTGEEISKTKFSYHVVKKEKGVLLIKNVFDVRTLTGEKIFSISRLYGIDPKTGRHVAGFGDRDREGTLFAPRFLKKQNYLYWHINYDKPASMTFQEEVNLFGLTVYRYQAIYHADQTKNLTHLPGVPKSRGVNLDITLQTWIEPITGRLIQYQDNTIAYYYDQQTGKRLHPWNKFSNNYTHTSVGEQVAQTRVEKQQLLFYHRVIPGVLAAIPLMMLLFIFGNKIPWGRFVPRLPSFTLGGKRLLGGAVLILLVVAAVAVAIFIRPAPSVITIGIASWNSQSEEYKRNIEGFKEGLKKGGFEEGKNVRFLIKSAETDKKVQREIIQSYVSAGVDLIYTLTTPGTLIAKGVTQSIPIVFSIVTYPVETGVVEALHRSGNNLVGTRNYIAVERQYPLFEEIFSEMPHRIETLGFVHGRGEPNSEFQFSDFEKLLSQRGVLVLDISAVSLGELVGQVASSIGKVDALYGACDNLIQRGGGKILIEMAIAHKKPPFACGEEEVMLGALAGNVTHFQNIGEISGRKAALILEGTLPTHLSTEAIEEDRIVINQKTAATLGIHIPEEIIKKARLIVRE
jgi:putative ABC transport system substrate-binding protein